MIEFVIIKLSLTLEGFEMLFKKCLADVLMRNKLI